MARNQNLGIPEKPKALIIGESFELTLALPNLLARSGFQVELITTWRILQKSRFVSKFDLIADINLAPEKASEKNLDDYSFIVISDDLTLKTIAQSNLDIATKLKLLPVNSEENLTHVYSKVGLSLVLSRHNIKTPDFIIAKGQEEIIAAANKLQFPVMVKTDSDGGGNGVFECKNIEDILNLRPDIRTQSRKSPLVIQKKIIGTELDLSALYRDGKLIYFNHAIPTKVVNKFGPSSLRIYSQLGIVDKKVFEQMQRLGEALGANGFVNISGIKSDSDDEIYIFEADMRPNTWVEFNKFIGDDPAARIQSWFKFQKTLEYPQPLNPKYPRQLLLPYFLRLPPAQLLLNKHRVWKYMITEEYSILAALAKRFLSRFLSRNFGVIYYPTRRILSPLKSIFRPRESRKAST